MFFFIYIYFHDLKYTPSAQSAWLSAFLKGVLLNFFFFFFFFKVYLSVLRNVMKVIHLSKKNVLYYIVCKVCFFIYIYIYIYILSWFEVHTKCTISMIKRISQRCTFKFFFFFFFFFKVYLSVLRNVMKVIHLSKKNVLYYIVCKVCFFIYIYIYIYTFMIWSTHQVHNQHD